jgi:TolB-like protein/Tfp pilus assembly protein PilF
MEQNSIRCWIAPRDITPGTPFAEGIIDGIKGSKVFILIYSSNSNISPQVIKEVDRAVHHGLAIIPVRIEDVPMSKQMEYYISNVHWMDALTPPLEIHIEKLCRVVRILLTMDTPGNENVRLAFDTMQEIKSKPGKNAQTLIDRFKKALLFIGLIVIAGLVILNITRRDSTLKPGMIESLVILPFDNYTGDEKLDYFVSGMHSSLISDVGKIGSLRVISETTSEAYKNAKKTLPQIASELDVDAVVEAQVMCLGDSICLQVRVVSADKKEKQLWVGNFHEDKRKILGLYNQVTKKIADEVMVKLSSKEDRLLSDSKIINKEAYDAVLKGNYYRIKLTINDLDTALKYYEMAKNIDPEFALAYVSIAFLWITRQQLGMSSTAEARPKIIEASMKAFDLDKSSAEVSSNLGSMYFFAMWDWEKSEAEYKRAIELNPNDAGTRMWYSNLLTCLGRNEEALNQIKIAVNLDPQNDGIHYFYGLALVFAHKYDDAIIAFQHALKISPASPPTHGDLGIVLALIGKYEEAVEQFKLGCANDTGLYNAYDKGYIEGGFRGAIFAYNKVIESRFNNSFWSPIEFALNYAMLGEIDKTFYWLEEAYKVYDPRLPYILHPVYDILHTDPRFKDLCQKMKLPYK